MKKKLLIPVLCILMMLIGGFATWAYFTSQDSVTNTFTIGDIEITMDEAKVTPDGVEVANADRVKTNEYHLIPGHEYKKDPTIHVAAKSDNCWLFVSVKNEIAKIECNDQGYVNIEDQMAENGWTKLEGVFKYGGQVYYHAVVAKSDVAQNVPVFQNFKIDGENAVNKSENLEQGTFDIAEYEDAAIVVKGYAVQADGFATAADAWAATFAETVVVE